MRRIVTNDIIRVRNLIFVDGKVVPKDLHLTAVGKNTTRHTWHKKHSYNPEIFRDITRAIKYKYTTVIIKIR